MINFWIPVQSTGCNISVVFAGMSDKTKSFIAIGLCSGFEFPAIPHQAHDKNIWRKFWWYTAVNLAIKFLWFDIVV